ncbi:alpha-(1,3)-fucosyltransferase fut-1-like [Lytechinus pictus]|uniref:alpha-(1,3)-fucosyltransferase fut-1-like n=1 Tax=Lytechinus pictus TaxID=7653 RepID=UPI0030BA060E
MNLTKSWLIRTCVISLCLGFTLHLLFSYLIVFNDHGPTIKKLKRSLVDVEDDVLHMDVDKMLNFVGLKKELNVMDSRLVWKLLRSRIFSNDECIIRIAKYCGNRCDHILGDHLEDPTEWLRFSCPFSESCVVETRFIGEANLTKRLMKSIDIILLVDSLHEGLHLDQLMAERPRGQLWVLLSRESPQHDHEYAPPPGMGNPYNLTMTYASDSDIYFPYCYLKRKPLNSMWTEAPPVPKKTKLIAWMASNCRRLSWRRGELVEELKNFLPIDTFGKCGDLGKLTDIEGKKVLADYKFYLALENSECREYITEKTWRTCLQNGIVPIVYGSPRKDYERILPPNSFIYLEDFSSIGDFVEFIYKLDKDDERYNRYFDWKKHREVVCLSARFFIMFSPEVNLCYLLRKLIHVFVFPETLLQNREPDFGSWWRGKCADASARKEVFGIDVHQPRIKKKKKKDSNKL